jgi:hypothetical protein
MRSERGAGSSVRLTASTGCHAPPSAGLAGEGLSATAGGAVTVQAFGCMFSP